MAIVEMKQISLLALNRDRVKLLRALQKLGCVQVEEAEYQKMPDPETDQRIEELHSAVSRLDLVIARLSPYDKHKQSMLSLRPEADDAMVASALKARGKLMALVDRAEEIERLRGDLKMRLAKAAASAEAISPWEALDMPLEDIRETRTSKLYLLTVSARRLPEFLQDVGEVKYVVVETLNTVRDTAFLLAASHKAEAERFEALFEAHKVQTVTFPDMKGTPGSVLASIREECAEIDRTYARFDEEIVRMAESLADMRILRDVSAMELDRLLASQKFSGTKSAFILKGWAPNAKREEITRAVKEISPYAQIEFTNPPEDEAPPVMLRNKPYITPFESIVKMFSLPDPNGIDPTFIMTPFWVCFFGMMVSDAGYGIVMGIVCAYISYKLKRRKGLGQMAFVLALGGVSTLFWGAMYGGWFSIENFIPPLLFAPMENPIGMLVLSVAMGCVHLLAGMGVAAYMNVKRGKPLDALYDQGFWLLLLMGLGLLLVNTAVGGVIALIGGVGILLFAGRSNKNIIKRISSGLGALYGVTGYVSDILSYARLFGMGLATGVIGMVVNTLAFMPAESGSVVGYIFCALILLFGHTLNFGINALGAYVHSCRLQYIEFFNKFYESGGRDFTPLTCENTRYIDIHTAY
ncbi:MAG: V-type ATP synthase subunit I [Christensenellales bacterium]|jgi:V/A-type H+-transporting ATPase subunit I